MQDTNLGLDAQRDMSTKIMQLLFSLQNWCQVLEFSDNILSSCANRLTVHGLFIIKTLNATCPLLSLPVMNTAAAANTTAAAAATAAPFIVCRWLIQLFAEGWHIPNIETQHIQNMTNFLDFPHHSIYMYRRGPCAINSDIGKIELHHRLVQMTALPRRGGGDGWVVPVAAAVKTLVEMRMMIGDAFCLLKQWNRRRKGKPYVVFFIPFNKICFQTRNSSMIDLLYVSVCEELTHGASDWFWEAATNVGTHWSIEECGL